MKRILVLSLVAFLGGALSLSAQKTDADGYVLTDLWKQYKAAEKADRPKTEAELLSKIKAEAMRRHLSVDFYDAATNYVTTVARRDWKQRDALKEALGKEVDQFNEPVVTFLYLLEDKSAPAQEIWQYVRDRADGFADRTEAFYKRGLGGFLGGALSKFVASDREYVLWRMIGYNRFFSAQREEIVQELKALVAGRYPNEAALEYKLLPDDKQRKAGLEALVARYEGKAAAFYPLAELLRLEFRELEEQKAASEDFRALWERCKAAEKKRKAFSGEEALIAKGCTEIEDLMEQMERSSCWATFSDGQVEVHLKNLASATLELKKDWDGDVLRSWNIKNPVRSFYVPDVICVEVPELPDGSYCFVVHKGDNKVAADYKQFTLSLALRLENRSWSVFVCDYRTGQPLEKARLCLLNSSDKVVVTEDVMLSRDGFTPLPASFQSYLLLHPRKNFSVRAEIGSRSSDSVEGIRAPRDLVKMDWSSLQGMIYKDRGAYNPGDTLRFKTILYSGDPAGDIHVRPKENVEAVLYDSEYHELARTPLKTGLLGSASGSFVIPEGLRGGWFALEIEKGDTEIASDRFRVDAFVLPTFELQYDRHDELFLPGKEIPVSGRLVSYSGHPLSGARIHLTISQRYNDKVCFEEDLLPDADDRFAVRFLAEEYGYYQIEALVTDATGETRSFKAEVYVSSGIGLDASLVNAGDGDFVLYDEYRQPSWRFSYRPRQERYIAGGDDLQLRFDVKNSEGSAVPMDVAWRLSRLEEKDTVLVQRGTQRSGEILETAPGGPGLYLLVSECRTKDGNEKDVTAEKSVLILLPGTDSDPLPAHVAGVFVAPASAIASGERMKLRIGSGIGELWAVVTLHGGEDCTPLYSRIVHTPAGRMETLQLDYETDYPEAVRLGIFAVKNARTVEFSREIRRAKSRFELPLSFTRFEDRVFPGTKYSFTLRTDPSVEAMVAVWDKSIDAVATNDWPAVMRGVASAPYLNTSLEAGGVTGQRLYEPEEEEMVLYDEIVIRSYGRAVKNKQMRAEVEYFEEADIMDTSPAMAADEAEEEEPALKIREAFSNALLFDPHLIPDADGLLEVSFRTSDKLSTYYVGVYVHDAEMRSAQLRKEMTVTLPVKLSVVEPKYLYEEDTYEVAVAVTSLAEETLSGFLGLSTSFVCGGPSVEAGERRSVTLAPGETVSVRFPVGPFPVSGADPGQLTLTASFVAPAFSDGVRLRIPVLPAKQTLTEAHSAILRSGSDRDALVRKLRAAFVNVSGADAVLKEISILDMVKEAIPGKVEPAAKDVLSLTEALYVRLLSGRLLGDSYDNAELTEQILACRNGDGGFGWFEGMDSSPVMTAVVMERMAKLRAAGFEVPDLSSSAAYLDTAHFSATMPLWRGWLSDGQYLRVRAMYASVPFAYAPKSAAQKKAFAEWKKGVADYLTPSAKDGRGLKGRILEKARRLLTLRDLADSSEGLALAKAWGLGSASKLLASWEADVRSLAEYAVEHKEGGWYFPNAVLPWRGLLESEAYAHALLCDLFAEILDRPGNDGLKTLVSAIPDGIRFWLMLQKETQKWDAEPAFVDALVSILAGSGEFLATKVLTLSATYEAPFRKIRAAGNGFTVERRFFRGENEEVHPGDAVAVGEKIRAEYRISSDENRSFIRLSAGREATLRPVRQLSGPTGWGIVRLAHHGRNLSFSPQGYRDVRSDCTYYYFDAYPEEKTVISEEFFVTQAGTFSAPVVTIESLYAPHYRANDGYNAPLTVKAE